MLYVGKVGSAPILRHQHQGVSAVLLTLAYNKITLLQEGSFTPWAKHA